MEAKARWQRMAKENMTDVRLDKDVAKIKTESNRGIGGIGEELVRK